MKFELGQIVQTIGVAEKFDEDLDFLFFVRTCLFDKHAKGDWGDLCDEDKAVNDEALKTGGRILSSYKYDDKITIWIITEWDRSATTVLFPNEY